MDAPGPHQGFSREQKIGFIFMLIFAIMTVGLGGLQLRNTIYGPFVIHANKDATLTLATTDEQTRLKNIDTDHDGLSDYDEIYVYGTSAYLPDTDSDGIPDGVEIKNGTDPLCPEGTKCTASDTSASTTPTSVVSPLFNSTQTAADIANQAGFVATSSTSSTTVPDLNALANQPAQLRQLLLSTGKITKEDLDKIDDATLVKKVQDLMNTSYKNSP